MDTFPWGEYLVVLLLVSIVFGVVCFVVWCIERQDAADEVERRRYMEDWKIPPPCCLCHSRRVQILDHVDGDVRKFRCLDCHMINVRGGDE